MASKRIAYMLTTRNTFVLIALVGLTFLFGLHVYYDDERYGSGLNCYYSANAATNMLYFNQQTFIGWGFETVYSIRY